MSSTSKTWGLPSYLLCAASVLVAGLSTPPAWTGTVTIALTGDTVPEGNGEFDSFIFGVGRPELTDEGQVLFWAQLQNTSSGGIDNNGLYLHTDWGRIKLAREGDTVPEGNGEIGLFDDTRFNNAGQTVFRTFQENTSGGTTDDERIYLYNGSELINLVRTGTPVPEGDGELDGFSEPSMNDAGPVAFASRLRNTSGGADDDEGLYLYDGSSVINLVRGEATVPNGNGDFGLIFSPRLNGVGQTLFEARVENTIGGTIDDEGLYLHDGSSVISLARKGNAVPEGNGDFEHVITNATNNAGQVAFWAWLNNTIGGADDDEGIYLTGGIDQINVARKGESLAGKTIAGLHIWGIHGAEDGRLSGLNGFAQVAFDADFIDGTQGVFLFTPELYWRGSAGDALWDSRTNWTLSIPRHTSTM